MSHPGLRALFSTLLMGGALAAGMEIMPLPAAYQSPVLYAIRGSTGIAVGKGPVFLLDEALFPHQCGQGRLGRDGTLALVAYTEPRCRVGVANLRPHLLPADLRVPWALVPAEVRLRLHRLGGAALEHLYDLALRVLHAPFFAQDYAPPIEESLQFAFKQAWSAPATRQAIGRALATFDRDQLDKLVSGLLPVFTEHARQNLWRTIRGSLSFLFGTESQEQREVMGQLMAEVFADPRVVEHLDHTLPPLLSSREAVAIGTVLVSEAGKALFADPRLQDLAARLLTDRRFLRLRPIGSAAEELFTSLPPSLLRMRHRRDHNPLATYVLRALVRGRPRFLVLLMTPEQERQLAKSNLPPEPTLGRTEL
jgi:hypothetical protein